MSDHRESRQKPQEAAGDWRCAVADPGEPERIEELKHTFTALIDGIEAASVYTARAIDDDSWRLIIEYKLSGEGVAVAADTIFHGNTDAHNTNTEIITYGWMLAFAKSLCRACKKAEEAAWGDDGSDDTSIYDISDDEEGIYSHTLHYETEGTSGT